MQTPQEDCELMASRLRAVTDHEVKVVKDGTPEIDEWSVYVNFDHNCALVLTPEMSGNSKFWDINAMQWDRTGGLSAEHYLGLMRPEFVPQVTKIFLDEEDRKAARMEALLDASAEQMQAESHL